MEKFPSVQIIRWIAISHRKGACLSMIKLTSGIRIDSLEYEDFELCGKRRAFRDSVPFTDSINFAHNPESPLSQWDYSRMLVSKKHRDELSRDPKLPSWTQTLVKRVSALSFSPDSKYLTASWEESVYVWSIPPNGIKIPLPYIPTAIGKVTCLAFTADAEHLIVGDNEGFIYVWKISAFDKALEDVSLEAKQNWEIEEKIIHPVENIGVAATKFLVALKDKIHICEMNGNRLNLLRTLNKVILLKQMKLSPDWKWLASFSPNSSTIVLYNLEYGLLECMLEGHTGNIINIIFDSTKNLLISFGWDKTVRHWDLSPDRLKNLSAKKMREMSSILELNSNQTILAAADFRNIILRETSSGKIFRILSEHERAISSIAFNPNNSDQLVSGDESGTVYIWDIQLGNKNLLYKHYLPVKGITFNQLGRNIAINYEDQAYIFSVNEKPFAFVFDDSYFGLEQDRKFSSIAWHPDNTSIAFGGPNGNISLAFLNDSDSQRMAHLESKAPLPDTYSAFFPGRPHRKGGWIEWEEGKSPPPGFSLGRHKVNKPLFPKISSISFHPEGKYLAGGGQKWRNLYLGCFIVDINKDPEAYLCNLKSCF